MIKSTATPFISGKVKMSVRDSEGLKFRSRDAPQQVKLSQKVQVPIRRV